MSDTFKHCIAWSLDVSRAEIYILFISIWKSACFVYSVSKHKEMGRFRFLILSFSAEAAWRSETV